MTGPNDQIQADRVRVNHRIGVNGREGVVTGLAREGNTIAFGFRRYGVEETVSTDAVVEFVPQCYPSQDNLFRFCLRRKGHAGRCDHNNYILVRPGGAS